MTQLKERPTQAVMLRLIRGLGLTCNVRDGEIRIDYRRYDPRYKGGDTGTAYFTDSREDAMRTALYMADWGGTVTNADVARTAVRVALAG